MKTKITKGIEAHNISVDSCVDGRARRGGEGGSNEVERATKWPPAPKQNKWGKAAAG